MKISSFELPLASSHGRKEEGDSEKGNEEEKKEMEKNNVPEGCGLAGALVGDLENLGFDEVFISPFPSIFSCLFMYLFAYLPFLLLSIFVICCNLCKIIEKRG